MDFDHVNGKEFNLSVAAKTGISMARVMREIGKCDVVCSNCHRMRTHNRKICAVNSAARVSALQAESPGFESLPAHQVGPR